MNLTENKKIQCPYCGESVDVIIDCSEASQQYIEDCYVCCRPISLHIDVDSSGILSVIAHHENDA